MEAYAAFRDRLPRGRSQRRTWTVPAEQVLSYETKRTLTASLSRRSGGLPPRARVDICFARRYYHRPVDEQRAIGHIDVWRMARRQLYDADCSERCVPGDGAQRHARRARLPVERLRHDSFALGGGALPDIIATGNYLNIKILGAMADANCGTCS
jgi:hypothetical protein